MLSVTYTIMQYMVVEPVHEILVLIAHRQSHECSTISVNFGLSLYRYIPSLCVQAVKDRGENAFLRKLV